MTTDSPHRAPPDRQCTAIRPGRDGKPASRCQGWKKKGHDLCPVHAGTAPNIHANRPEERQCSATSNKGDRCTQWALKGQAVCKYHGGSAPQAKRAAERRLAEAAVEKAAHRTLARIGAKPVDNPLTALAELAGEVLAFKEILAERVNELEEIRYQGAAGEQIRAEIVLYERAMDRAGNLLATIAKLNIDERLAAITEKQAEAVIGAIDAALAHAGITGPAATGAKQAGARYLRAVR
ncbi:hypothetical protein EST92_11795 [Streptomyces sp. TM32]|uniref:hypothetical protein n=1 Tax=Streptomyces sp. TM32 TaxID=1652669 RepID=UPI00101341B7|nr:hypothetical protein [Streptomyces sp. TM32]RXS84234.1 hypothetical protein EST92_11795 [Streptomyces sp. TM32]